MKTATPMRSPAGAPRSSLRKPAIAARKRFVIAVSGRRTPWVMLRTLAGESRPIEDVHLFQADKRAARPGDADSNLMRLAESLLEHGPIRPEQIHPTPVEEPDLAVTPWGPPFAAHHHQRLPGNT